MNKKTLILIVSSFVGVILIAGLVASVLFLVNRTHTDATQKVSTEVRTLEDGTKDYGACTIFDTAKVKTDLASASTTIQDPQSVGLARFGNGDEVQTCVYAFAAGGTQENEFNLKDSFSIEVFTHHDAEARDAFMELQKADLQPEEGIGDLALYGKRLFNENDVKYVLYVFNDLRHYAFIINDPAGAPELDEVIVKTALINLVRSVNF